MLFPHCGSTAWPMWRKIIFRFVFIYAALYINPLDFFTEITKLEIFTNFNHWLFDPIVYFFNDHVWHIKDELVPMAGSGDTSMGWAQLVVFTGIALIGVLIWSVLDRRRPNYEKLNYFLALGLRYYIAFIAFAYGIIKIFAQQMIFPSTEDLATPLGDLLPMRFSWFFIGYSTPYQVFSGIMECLVGLLLLWRRTATAGTVMAVVVFVNVMMLNLSYDIPVKIFSIHMTVFCLILLAHEWQRIHAFFIMNREAARCNLYDVVYTSRFGRITRVVLKIVFIFAAIGATAWQAYGWMKEGEEPPPPVFVKAGLYDVMFMPTASGDFPDSLRWHEMVFNQYKNGSFGRAQVNDTSFRNVYSRVRFAYEIDSTAQMIEFRKKKTDSLPVFALHFTPHPDSGFIFYGKIRNDSVRMRVSPSKHKFALAERQFHWLSEDNR